MKSPTRLDLIHQSINTLVEQVKGFARDALRSGDAGGSAPPVTAETVERHIFGELLGIGKLVMEQFVDEVGEGNQGSSLTHGGVEYERKAYQSVSLLTVFGVVHFPRWLYHAKGQGCYSPVEAAASLPDRQASYFVQRLVGRLSLRDTYEECAKSMDELFGLKLSTHTAEEIVKELSGYHEAYAAGLAAPAAGAEETIQVVGFDGKGVPMAKAGGSRPAARLKKGEKRNRKKEAMVGLEYVVAPRERSAELLARALVKPEELSGEERARLHADRPAPEIYYQASLTAGRDGIIAEMGERAEKRQAACSHSLRQACLIDGATSLAKLAKATFPEAELILDIIHVNERFWQVAHLFHGEGSDESKDLVYDLLRRTLEGKIGYVMGGLRQRAKNAPLSPTKQAHLEAILSYFENHRTMMHYDRYLRLGMPIATGAVESACGHLVKDRMEKAGARWSLSGGEAMLRLRSIYASGYWDDYLTFYQQQEHHRLYGQALAA